MPAGIRIEAPRVGLGVACRSVLDSLPIWLGVPEFNDEYIAPPELTASWAGVDEHGSAVGVLAPTSRLDKTNVCS
jgi:hypothetical protein